MADETPRLGLPIYTSGTDLHPTREDFNERMELLEEAVAIARQGTRDDRPIPSTRGTLFMETDTRLLWFDTGDEWIRVVRIGNDGPGRALDIDGTGSEGSSEWAARADHTHPLPLATASQAGALSADDKALLNTASANATSSALARRNGSGQMSTAAPTTAGHATNRQYVDTQVGTRAPSSHTHHANDLDRGTLDPGRLPNATTSAQGAMSAADKEKLNGATSVGVADRLILRDAEGRARISNPDSGADIANKRYVDGRIINHRHNADDINFGTLEPARLPTATHSQQGAISAADKALLDGATVSAIGSALARRNGSGQINVGTPTTSTHTANKSYVDNRVGSVYEGAPLGNTNLNSHTTPGLFYSSGATSGSEEDNFPPGADESGGVLEVLRHTPSSVMQRYTVAEGSHPMWIRRRYVDGSWSSWSRIDG